MNAIDRVVAQLAGGLLDASVKAFFVLLVAGAIVLLLRRRSAAMRHMVWTLAVVSVLLLPALSLVMPRWRLAVLPAKDKPAPADAKPAIAVANRQTLPQSVALPAPPDLIALAAPVTKDKPRVVENHSALAPSRAEFPEQGLAATVKSATPFALARSVPRSVLVTTCVLLVWGLGAFVVGLVRLVGIAAVRINSYRAARDSISPLSRCMDQLANGLRIRRPISLLLSDTCMMPMTWGVLRPRVILPVAAVQWPTGRAKAVLLHELAHVRRWDCFTLGLAHLACMLYWFNPLAWVAQARMRCEQERACDDAVLAHGATATSYARDLLLVARTLRADPLTSLAAVTMARRSRLRSRIMAILDSQVSRGRVARRTIIATVIVAAATLLPLSAVRMVPRQPLAKADAVAPIIRPVRTLNHLMTNAKTNQPLADVEVEAHFNSGKWKAKRVGAARLEQSELKMDLFAVDAKTQTPISGANIEVGAFVVGSSRNWTGKTDEAGRYDIRISPPTPGNVRVAVSAPSYAPRAIQWPLTWGAGDFPAKFTMELEKGTAIGGIVQDEQKKPVAGATVSFIVASQKISVPYGTWQYAKTDAQGRWKIDNAPSDLHGMILELDHPQHPHTTINDPPQPDRFRDQTALVVIKTGATVTGVVKDNAGKPIREATVTAGEFHGASDPVVKTAADGSFALHVDDGSRVLTVWAAGFAPQTRKLDVATGMAPVQFTLLHGHELRGRVVDTRGSPLDGARIYLMHWGDNERLEWNAQTDGNGRFVWADAPGEQVTMSFTKEGFMSREALLSPDAAEQLVTLSAQLHVRGTVTDAQSGKLVEDFEIVDGYQPGGSRIIWEPILPPQKFQQSGGEFDHAVHPGPYAGYAVRVIAPGYGALESRLLKPDEGQVTLDFKLSRKTGTEGIVNTPDRKPASGAEIYAVLPASPTFFHNGRLNEAFPRQRDRELARQTARVDGSFAFPPDTDPQALYVILHDSGYAMVRHEELIASAQVKLTAWGAVEGTLWADGKPDAGKRLMLQPQGKSAPQGIMFAYDAVSDGGGHFVFGRVMAGNYTVARGQASDGPWLNPLGAMVWVNVAPGETAQVNLGRTGRVVVGRLVAPENVRPEDLTQTNLIVKEIQVRLRLIQPPPPHLFVGIVNADGTFRVPDVPPGRYSLSAMVIGDRSRLIDRGMGGVKEIEVPSTGSGVVDTGKLSLASR